MKTFSFFSAIALALTLSVSTVHAATDVYGVTDVQSGQFLNMRSGAGTSYAITGSIPSNGQGVVTTGEQKKVNGTVWAKVYWHGVGGWVSKRYLSPESKKTAAKPATPAAKTKATVPAAKTKATAPAAKTKATAPVAKTKATVPAAKTKATVPAAKTKATAPAAKPATPAVTPRKVVVPPVKVPSYITPPKR